MVLLIIAGASEINPDGNLDFSFDQTFVFFAVGGNSITVGCMDEEHQTIMQVQL